MSAPNRKDLVKAIIQAEKTLRWAGSLLVLPGRVRYRLLEQANALAALLGRVE